MPSFIQQLISIVFFSILIEKIFFFNFTLKLKEKNQSFRESRDWLMWFFLMIMVTNITKNCFNEIFKLCDVLYKENEQLPRPDINSVYSIIKLAPLAVFISISSSFGSQENSSGQNSKTKNLIFPEYLMENYNFLQECITFQNQNDYALAICLNACKSQTLF